MENNYTVYALIKVDDPVYQHHQKQILNNHVTYNIIGQDPHGSFQIRRRYQEFFILRQKLVERFIGLYVPPIPSKKFTVGIDPYEGSYEEKFVQQRRRFLDYFCKKIAERPYMFDSDIFQMFIRRQNDFQKIAKFIPILQYQLMTNVYEVQFKKQMQNVSVPQLLIQNQADYDYLKKVQKKLQLIRSEFIEVASIKKQFILHFNECYSKVLPKYEQDFMTIHEQNSQQLVITGNNDYRETFDQHARFSEVSPLNDYIQMISYDIREARALIEAIDSRNAFEAKKQSYQSVRRGCKQELEKLKSGKTTIKSIFTSGNKEVQIKELQAKIPLYEKYEDYLSRCLPLVNLAIHKDIERYKKIRAIDYVAVLSQIAQKQIKSLFVYGNFFKSTHKKLQDQPKKIEEMEIKQK